MAKTTDKTTDKSADQGADTPGVAVSQATLIEITCPSGPRRRAGLNFGPAPVTLDVSTLTREQQQTLGEDTMLVIRAATVAADTNSAE